MSDILDEVVRERSDEKKILYFKKSLPIIAILTVVVVLVMMIKNYLNSKAAKHNIEMGDTLIKSLENIQSEPRLTIEGLEHVAENAKNNGKDIAILQLLAIQISAKNLDQALTIAEKIAEDKAYLDLTRAYARLMWISIMLENRHLSQDDTTKLNKYFDSFSEKSPFFGSAGMLKALWQKNIDKKTSMIILQNLVSNSSVSPIIKEEAKALISNLQSQTKE